VRFENISAAKPNAEPAKALEKVSAGARSACDGYWYQGAIHDNPYANWSPPATPWQFCHNESFFAGNVWRAEMLAEFQKQVDKYAEIGPVHADSILNLFFCK
jgi:ribose transport system substrate-binding protein